MCKHFCHRFSSPTKKDTNCKRYIMSRDDGMLTQGLPYLRFPMEISLESYNAYILLSFGNI